MKKEDDIIQYFHENRHNFQNKSIKKYSHDRYPLKSTDTQILEDV